MPDQRTPGGETPAEPQSIHERILGALDSDGAEPEQKRRKKPPVSEEVDDQTFEDDIQDDDDLPPEDDDLDDDPDGGTDDEDDEWGEEDEEDPAEPDDEFGDDDTDLHTVKVDGEEVQVPYDELVKGYSRQAHFTRSMQALRAREQEFEGEIAAVTNERQQYGVLLERLSQHLDTLTSGRSPEEWAELERTDPLTFATERLKEQERQERKRDVEAEQNALRQRQEADAQKQLQALQQQEAQKLLRAIPEWQDDKVYQKETKRIQAYAKAHGFTPEELAQVIDHRIIIMLRDAALGARVKAEKGKLKGKRRGPKPVRPSGGKKQTQPRKRKAARQARETLKETGRVEDAAKALRHLL